MTIVQERLAALEAGLIRIDRGSHHTFESGHCSMEVVAWLAGEGHTDAPVCASPVLRRFVIALNDRWTDDQRQALVPYLPRMVGTAGDGLDDARLQIALGSLSDAAGPWLRLAGLEEDAEKLAAADDPSTAGDVLWDARNHAWDLRATRRAEIRRLVEAHLKTRGAAAAADAVADAVADADADADAVADAAAVADAVAAAAAAAVADAAADAGLSWNQAYNAAYKAARPVWEKAIAESEHPQMVAVRDLAAAQRGFALDLLDRMIKPEVVAS